MAWGGVSPSSPINWFECSSFLEMGKRFWAVNKVDWTAIF
jgi:hypothetical protein